MQFWNVIGIGNRSNDSKKLGLYLVSSTETEIVSTGDRIHKENLFRYYRLARGDL